jgi:hypothetical protein
LPSAGLLLAVAVTALAAVQFATGHPFTTLAWLAIARDLRASPPLRLTADGELRSLAPAVFATSLALHPDLHHRRSPCAPATGCSSSPTAAKSRSAAYVDLPEFRGDDDLITNRSERVPHKLLIRERAIDLRRVEERRAEAHRVPDQRNRLAPVQSGAAVVAKTHAAKPERRYLQPARPQHALLQCAIHAFNRTTIHTCRGQRYC